MHQISEPMSAINLAEDRLYTLTFTHTHTHLIVDTNISLIIRIDLTKSSNSMSKKYPTE